MRCFSDDYRVLGGNWAPLQRVQSPLREYITQRCEEHKKESAQGSHERDEALHDYTTTCVLSVRRGMLDETLPEGGRPVCRSCFSQSFSSRFFSVVTRVLPDIRAQVKSGCNLTHTFLRALYISLFRGFKIILDAPNDAFPIEFKVCQTFRILFRFLKYSFHRGGH